MAEQTFDNHLNLIDDGLNGILPAASASFEKWVVLAWRVAGKLPSHLQGGATAALKQTLFERRLHSTPQEAAHLCFDAWDDLPHSEVQDATYSPTIEAWRALYDEFFS